MMTVGVRTGQLLRCSASCYGVKSCVAHCRFPSAMQWDYLSASLNETCHTSNNSLVSSCFYGRGKCVDYGEGTSPPPPSNSILDPAPSSPTELPAPTFILLFIPFLFFFRVRLKGAPPALSAASFTLPMILR